jgi:hypothetical protein
MGDLSSIMPVIHPYAPGAKGTSHGNDYYIDDPERACVKSAIWQVAILKKLLENGVSKVETGVFAADMKVDILNDGPVTIVMDTDIWESKK